MTGLFQTRKSVAAAVAAVYFLSNCVFLHAAETNIWKERRQQVSSAALPSAPADPLQVLKGLPDLQPAVLSPSMMERLSADTPKDVLRRYEPILKAIPQADGSVRRLSPPKKDSGKTVVFLQDIHKNDEAQANLDRIVSSLVPAVGLIALEAAFAPLDLAKFRAPEDRDAVRQAADHMLAERQISGPVHAGYVHEGEIPPFVGVDDLIHYKANVDAYRRSAPAQIEARFRVAVRRYRVEKRKKEVFGGPLLAFDRAVTAYRAGRLSFGDYVQTIAENSPLGGRRPGEGGQLALFLSALRMEKSLDFAQVEKERSRLIEEAVRRFSKPELDRLMQFSVAYRLGSLSHTDYYRMLRELCGRSGISLSAYPAMDRYLQYVILSGRIDADKMFKEINAAEKAAYARLARSGEEKALITESRRLALTDKLMDFSLTPDEWAEYNNALPFFSSPLVGEGRVRGGVDSSFPHGFSGNPSKTSSSLSTSSPNASIGDPVHTDLSSFKSFYEEAEARNQAMADNLLKAMDDRNVKTAAFVAGGFHTAGMTGLLTGRGVTVIEVAPKLTKIDGAASAYLGVFTQERTPLEHLFKGDRLFVNDMVDRPGTLASIASLLKDTAESARATFARLTGGKLTAVSITENRREADEETADGKAHVSLRRTKDGFKFTQALAGGLFGGLLVQADTGLAQGIHFSSTLIAGSHFLAPGLLPFLGYATLALVAAAAVHALVNRGLGRIVTKFSTRTASALTLIALLTGCGGSTQVGVDRTAAAVVEKTPAISIDDNLRRSIRKSPEEFQEQAASLERLIEELVLKAGETGAGDADQAAYYAASCIQGLVTSRPAEYFKNVHVPSRGSAARWEPLIYVIWTNLSGEFDKVIAEGEPVIRHEAGEEKANQFREGVRLLSESLRLIEQGASGATRTTSASGEDAVVGPPANGSQGAVQGKDIPFREGPRTGKEIDQEMEIRSFTEKLPVSFRVRVLSAFWDDLEKEVSKELGRPSHMNPYQILLRLSPERRHRVMEARIANTPASEETLRALNEVVDRLTSPEIPTQAPRPDVQGPEGRLDSPATTPKALWGLFIAPFGLTSRRERFARAKTAFSSSSRGSIARFLAVFLIAFGVLTGCGAPEGAQSQGRDDVASVAGSSGETGSGGETSGAVVFKGRDITRLAAEMGAGVEELNAIITRITEHVVDGRKYFWVDKDLANREMARSAPDLADFIDALLATGTSVDDALAILDEVAAKANATDYDMAYHADVDFTAVAAEAMRSGKSVDELLPLFRTAYSQMFELVGNEIYSGGNPVYPSRDRANTPWAQRGRAVEDEYVQVYMSYSNARQVIPFVVHYGLSVSDFFRRFGSITSSVNTTSVGMPVMAVLEDTFDGREDTPIVSSSRFKSMSKRTDQLLKNAMYSGPQGVEALILSFQSNKGRWSDEEKDLVLEEFDDLPVTLAARGLQDAGVLAPLQDPWKNFSDSPFVDLVRDPALMFRLLSRIRSLNRSEGTTPKAIRKVLPGASGRDALRVVIHRSAGVFTFLLVAGAGLASFLIPAGAGAAQAGIPSWISSNDVLAGLAMVALALFASARAVAGVRHARSLSPNLKKLSPPMAVLLLALAACGNVTRNNPMDVSSVGDADYPGDSVVGEPGLSGERGAGLPSAGGSLSNGGKASGVAAAGASGGLEGGEKGGEGGASAGAATGGAEDGGASAGAAVGGAEDGGQAGAGGNVIPPAEEPQPTDLFFVVDGVAYHQRPGNGALGYLVDVQTGEVTPLSDNDLFSYSKWEIVERDDHRYLFISEGSRTINIFNIDDPKAPVLAGTVDLSPENYSDSIVSGNRLYVIAGSYVSPEILTYDISSISSPVFLGRSSLAFIPSTITVLDSGHLLIGDRPSSSLIAHLSVLDVSNPEQVVEAGTFDPQLPRLQKIYVDRSEKRLYAMTLGGLQIWDLADPSSPRQLSVLEGLEWAEDFSLYEQDGRSYLITTSEWNGSISMVDVTDAEAPFLMPSSPITVKIGGNYIDVTQVEAVEGMLYVSASSTLRTGPSSVDYFDVHLEIDITNPLVPVLAKSIFLETPPVGYVNDATLVPGSRPQGALNFFSPANDPSRLGAPPSTPKAMWGMLIPLGFLFRSDKEGQRRRFAQALAAWRSSSHGAFLSLMGVVLIAIAVLLGCQRSSGNASAGESATAQPAPRIPDAPASAQLPAVTVLVPSGAGWKTAPGRTRLPPSHLKAAC